MWKFSCLIVIIFLSVAAYAQNAVNDVPEIRESKWNYIRTHSSEIFRLKDTTRWMFRWDGAAITSPLIQSYLVISDFDLSFEYLPVRNWSVGVTARKASSFSSYYNYETYPAWAFGMELRNYLRKEEHGPNLNGLYWSLKAETGNRNIAIDESIQYVGYRATGRMGFQTLLSKQFFVDLSLGLGADYTVTDQYTTTTTDESLAVKVVTELGWKPIIDPQIKLGWALSRPRPSVTRTDLWLRGQNTKSIQYKIDLFGLFNHNLSGISTSFELEKAFGQSGFSVILGTAGEWHRPDHITGADLDQLYVEKHTEQSWQVYVEPRWYYNVRKRLRKNMTNNVFSGNFISLLIGHQQIYYKQDFEYQPYVGLRQEATRSGAELSWGMQRSFFNIAFAEFRLGGSAMIEHSIADTGRPSSVYLIAALADVKVGLKF